MCTYTSYPIRKSTLKLSQLDDATRNRSADLKLDTRWNASTRDCYLKTHSCALFDLYPVHSRIEKWKARPHMTWTRRANGAHTVVWFKLLYIYISQIWRTLRLVPTVLINDTFLCRCQLVTALLQSINLKKLLLELPSLWPTLRML